jgi:hypothetical protein
VAEVWRYGSVVRSWLLDLTASALSKNAELSGIAPWVADSGEGRWTVQEAVDLDVSVVEYVIAASRQNDYPLDLRLMERGWQDYRFAKHGNALRSWQELFMSSVKTTYHEPPSQVRSKQDELQLVRENVKRLMQYYPDDVAKQINESGLTRSTYYVRRKEVLQGL